MLGGELTGASGAEQSKKRTTRRSQKVGTTRTGVRSMQQQRGHSQLFCQPTGQRGKDRKIETMKDNTSRKNIYEYVGLKQSGRPTQTQAPSVVLAERLLSRFAATPTQPAAQPAA
jgi:hypothetical protein